LLEGTSGNPEGQGPRDADHVAVVLMGHGTSHPADSLYTLMSKVLERDYRNVFLGTMDGHPDFEEVMEAVCDSGARKVRLMPFLLVVGAHGLQDLAGYGPSSWKSLFLKEGFHVEVNLQGMLDNPKVQEIFIEHTREAMNRTKSRC
jgi:sirohydrochlorin cobaltochelatase